MSTINGIPGASVRAAQFGIMGARWGDSKWTHVFGVGEDDVIYQAQPNGLWRGSLAAYVDTVLSQNDQVMFVDVDGMTTAQRTIFCEVGEEFADVPVGYSPMSYPYLAANRFATHLGLHVEPLRKRIADGGNLICSQSVDQQYTRALGGITRPQDTAVGFRTTFDSFGTRDGFFNDGRALQDVIPADFHKWLRTDPRARKLSIQGGAR
jgi:hypothetical protein